MMPIFLISLLLLLVGCAVSPSPEKQPSPLSLNPTLSGAAPKLVFAGGNAQPETVIQPHVYSMFLAWDYVPNPGDEQKPIAFNVWGSTNLTDWDYIDTTTNTQYLAESINPTDFYNVSSFFP